MAEALLAQAQQLINHLSLVDQDDPWQEFFKAGDALGSKIGNDDIIALLAMRITSSHSPWKAPH